MKNQPRSFSIRVWDLPTRLFHWALSVCVVGSVASVQFGGNAMEWHFRLGYAVLALLMFRLIWGIVGGHWSRFASFIYSPRIIFNYIKGQRLPEHAIGHNPMGAVSVFALLGLLLVQIASGLISDDEIGATGPLALLVSNKAVQIATFYHKDIGKLILIGLIVLHIGTIFFYLLKKKENLIHSMIQGDKRLPINARNSRDNVRTRALAFATLLSCAAFVIWLVKSAGTV